MLSTIREELYVTFVGNPMFRKTILMITYKFITETSITVKRKGVTRNLTLFVGSSFKCTMCHHKFAAQDKLEMHMDIHLNQKWSCELCGKKLSRSDMQKQSMRTVLINLTSASESDVSVNGSSRSLRFRNSDLVLQVVEGSSKTTVQKSDKNPVVSN